MRYHSTRSLSPDFSFLEAVELGLAPDGGLFVPASIPRVSLEELKQWRRMSYIDLSFQVLRLFIPDSELSDSQLQSLLSKAYSSFDGEPVRVRQVKDVTVAELFHGPTLSFKDLALQFLGALLELLATIRGTQFNVVVATSGDTGSAALAAIAGKQNVSVYVLYPDQAISPIQELQMTTATSKSSHAIAVDGSFDDCQEIVKKLFERGNIPGMTAMNSINIARVLAQIVYYFYIYLHTAVEFEEFSVAVPTGWYSKEMGLPLVRLMVATNENDILHRFFKTGEYSRRQEVVKTISPSMDIQVASNFERYLYYATGSTETVSELMKSLKTKGQFQVTPECLHKCQSDFLSARYFPHRIDQTNTKTTIKEVMNSANYLLDPHSAIAFASSRFITPPIIVLATAHYGKFLDAVETATGVKMELPEKLKTLKDKAQKRVLMTRDVGEIERFVLKNSRRGKLPLYCMLFTGVFVAHYLYTRLR